MRYDLNNPFPLSCSQGETKKFRFVLYKVDGTIYNLTGATLRCQVRDFLRVLVFEPTVTIINATQGIVELSVTAAQASRTGYFVYDIRVDILGAIDYLNLSTFIVEQTSTS